MLSEKLIQHIIQYLKDHPSSVRFDTFREQAVVHVHGNLGERSMFHTNNFHSEFTYDKDGKITAMNGVTFTFDSQPLADAITDAIARNFILKRKKVKLGV